MAEADDEELQPVHSPATDPTRERIRRLVQESRSGERLTGGAEIQSLPRTMHLKAKDHEQDIALKKKYADWLLGAVVGQLVGADLVFIVYAWAGKHWDLEAVVINVWLGATLVQVIGVVTIVTRYLFPRRDRTSGSADRSG